MRDHMGNRKVQTGAVGVAVAIVICVFVSCAVGPDYKRPTVDAPSAFRTAASDTNRPVSEESFGNIGWWRVFNEPQLQSLIEEALTNSWGKIARAASRSVAADYAFAIFPHH